MSAAPVVCGWYDGLLLTARKDGTFEAYRTGQTMPIFTASRLGLLKLRIAHHSRKRYA